MARANIVPPDPEGLNNDRAEWAREALLQFCEETGLDLDADGYETALGDLIVDLHHLADREGISWDRLTGSFHDLHYTAETANHDEEAES